MRVEAFNFELPEDRIALRPVEPRDRSRLLSVDPSAAAPALRDHCFADLPGLLQSGDLLVLNDTRVIAAELRGHRLRGDLVAGVSVTLHQRVDGSRWRAFARPAKRLKPGDRLVFGALQSACGGESLSATVAERGEAGEVTLDFELTGSVLDSAIAVIGQLPLPPYIAGRRQQDARDQSDYQTVYAQNDGAVAAPTAGLHFTGALLDRLRQRGVQIITVTLHVGAATFLPVKARDTDDHRMHAEWGSLSRQAADAVNRARASGGHIIAAGTTSLRLLESATDGDGQVTPFDGTTDIFITPGYRFRAVDRLITNFHLPRSTLFMLVSALCGLDCMQQAYAHAIASRYRFYSYGDACLLSCAPPQ
jgi:S-adenosylmethionine:tRNA ribosyltransferase-isomerase